VIRVWVTVSVVVDIGGAIQTKGSGALPDP
jgi:hypothetical protein